MVCPLTKTTFIESELCVIRFVLYMPDSGIPPRRSRTVRCRGHFCRRRHNRIRDRHQPRTRKILARSGILGEAYGNCTKHTASSLLLVAFLPPPPLSAYLFHH